MERKLLLMMMMFCAWTFQAQDNGDNCTVVVEESQSFCQSQGSGNDYYRPAVQHLQATANEGSVVWFDTASSETPLDMDEILVDGEDYYAAVASAECEERAMVIATVFEAPNAGGTTLYTIAEDAEPFDLLDIYDPSILGPPEAGGTFTPPLASGTTVFDPAEDAAGQYQYLVTSPNGFCSDDVSYIYITITPAEDDGPQDDPVEEENCPLVEFSEQVFCESQGTGNDFYRPAVEHLEATANGDEIRWYDTPNSIEPLSPDEILVDGEDYYAGNASGTCYERARVDVRVNASPNAGRTTLVTFCSDSGPVDVMEYLMPSILGEADQGGEIVPPFTSGTTMFDPSVDAAGSYEYHVASPNEFCPDDTAVIYISVSEAATAGEDAEVTFSPEDEPVDLYSLLVDATPGSNVAWSPAMASGTGVFDPSQDAAGVYTVTVFNDEGCEDDVATVTVYLDNQQSDPEQNCPIVEVENQVFCESQGTGNDFYRPSVAHLQATANGDAIRWYDTELSGEPLDPEEILVDGEDYYAGNASSSCNERQRVVVTLQDSPNAGKTTFYTVSATDEPFDVLDIYEESILGPPQAGGTVEPPLASNTTVFDPAVDDAGQYVYTVASTSDCPDDSSFFTITITPGEEEAQEEAMMVSMYPNPSKGDVNLSVGEEVKASSVRIVDLNGNTVKTILLDSEAQLQNLDLSSLTPSLYFAEIQTDNGKVVKRIIKN